MVKVLMFTSCRHCGLTSLGTQQAIAFDQSQSLRFAFVSDNREQEPGLFDALGRVNGEVHVVTNLDDHQEFTSKAHQLRDVIARVNPDVIHVQTNWQLALVLRARLADRNKARMVYTVHGFRNSSSVKAPFARAVISGALLLTADKVITPSSFVHERFAILGAKRFP